MAHAGESRRFGNENKRVAVGENLCSLVSVWYQFPKTSLEIPTSVHCTQVVHSSSFDGTENGGVVRISDVMQYGPATQKLSFWVRL